MFLKYPSSNAVHLSNAPLKLLCASLSFASGLFLISRFSMAGGLASDAVVVQFHVYVCVYVCKWLHTYRKGLVCACVCMCVCVNLYTTQMHPFVSALAWSSHYRPEQNSLVESSYQNHVRGTEKERGNDKWLGHTSRN